MKWRAILLIFCLGCASLGIDIRAEVRDRHPTCADYVPMQEGIEARLEYLNGIYEQTNSFVEGQILAYEMAALVDLALDVQNWHNENCKEA